MSIYAVEYDFVPQTTASRDQYRPEHRAWLTTQREAGKLLASGPYSDGSGALLVFQTTNEDELKTLLTQDPFAIQRCIADYRIKSWNPVIGLLKEYL